MHNIFQKSISHILKVKPFFYNIRNNIPLKEMELDYLKKELNKNGNNFYSLLDGCLDCINENNTLLKANNNFILINCYNGIGIFDIK